MVAEKLVEVIYGVTSAYAFSVRRGEFAPTIMGVIANSRGEALDNLIERLGSFEWPEEEITFFGCGFALLQPAMITCWRRNKTIEEKGYYAFLQGFFFARYGDFQVISGCRQEKTSTGWYATIYGHSHSVKPL